VFGETAALYDRARPMYPVQLVDEVAAQAGVPASGPALEVGCGTGKATVMFAMRDVELLALEPSVEMAALASRNTLRYPNVSIETVSFEGWSGPPERFALLFAAHSWHWLQREMRLTKAHRLLAPGGSLALFWNIPDWSANPLREPLDDLYERFAPDLAARRPGYPGTRVLAAQSWTAAELEASQLFEGVMIREYRWCERYPTERYVELLETQSDHRMLSSVDRGRLLTAVANVIDEGGGELRLNYVAELYLSRRVAS
jgi:SAM-dependent methyltransferase